MRLSVIRQHSYGEDNTISSDIQTQFKDYLELHECFSLQFDESTDISDTLQLAIIVRTAFSDFTINEELLKVLKYCL